MRINNLLRSMRFAAFFIAPFCFTSAAQADSKIAISSALAQPLMLVNSAEPNYLKVSLTGFPQELKKRSPINLALVIDRSSSMSAENRIENAREAAITAVSLLNENDTLSVITYDSAVEIIVPATKVKDKKAIIDKIRKNTNPQGMTALFAGVSKGLDQVSKYLDKELVNRIILLSDGQANVGPSSISEVAELAKRAAKKGVAISTIGLGNAYNEDLMTAIASYSDGNHAYVQKSADLEKVFAREFDDVMSVVAQDVEVTIRLASNVKPLRLLGRDGEIRGNLITVKLNQLYSKQEKYVLLEIAPEKGAKNEEKSLAEVSVRYANLANKREEKYQENVRIRYSDSENDVKSARVDEVIVDSEIQKAALETERAIKLMDQGKFDEAKKVVKGSKERLKELPAASPMAMEKQADSVAAFEMLDKDLETNNAEVSRKAAKSRSYDSQNQVSKSPKSK